MEKQSPKKDIALAILLLSWNTADLLADCLRSIPAGAGNLTCRVIVVDNASTDGSAAMVEREFPDVQLIRSPENLGFAGGNNLGLRTAHGDYVLLLNSDTLVKPGALQTLIHCMDEHPQAGACGPRLLRSNGTPQPYAFGSDPTIGYLMRRGLGQLVFHRPLHNWATDQVQQVSWISGACMMVRRAAIEQVGLLDENLFMYFEDNDWCLRMRQAGWLVYYDPRAEIVHIGGQSLKQNPRAQKAYYSSLRYFYKKHYSPLACVLLEFLLLPYRWLAGR
ncbi:MAG: glycosyltransferase family 2 protein [Anaerolineae bacterium]|nr:glycosyltransferase family 2 protein [Anaerolineae bacterium]